MRLQKTALNSGLTFFWGFWLLTQCYWLLPINAGALKSNIDYYSKKGNYARGTLSLLSRNEYTFFTKSNGTDMDFYGKRAIKSSIPPMKAYRLVSEKNDISEDTPKEMKSSSVIAESSSSPKSTGFSQKLLVNSTAASGLDNKKNIEAMDIPKSETPIIVKSHQVRDSEKKGRPRHNSKSKKRKHKSTEEERSAASSVRDQEESQLEEGGPSMTDEEETVFPITEEHSDAVYSVNQEEESNHDASCQCNCDCDCDLLSRILNPQALYDLPTPRMNGDRNRFGGTFRSCINPGQIALTYDDGPSPYTNELLDILKEFNVKASFFIVGSHIRDEAHRRTVQRIYDEGHIVASHSYYHDDFTTMTPAELKKDLERTALAIGDIIGVEPAYIRPPYGEYNDDVQSLLYSMGYTIFLWNHDTNDWKIHESNPEGIYESIKTVVKSEDPTKTSLIPLMHDLYKGTVDQQRKIIKTAVTKFKIVPLDECISYLTSPYRELSDLEEQKA